MKERKVPEELAALDEELDRAGRRIERQIDPGPTALAVSIAILVLIGALMLPWTGPIRGWEVLAGLEPRLGVLPRLFTYTSLGFGLVVSALALATRWWALAWLAAVGCGISVVTGLWAIWSRQVGAPVGATGPGVGLVLAVLAVVTLTVCWVRIAGRR
jgi:hypothetical protein